jgi:hypothetical protein
MSHFLLNHTDVADEKLVYCSEIGALFIPFQPAYVTRINMEGSQGLEEGHGRSWKGLLYY